MGTRLRAGRMATSGFRSFIIARLDRTRTGDFVYLACLLLITGVPMSACHANDDPQSDALIVEAEKAFGQGNHERALTLLDQAIEAVPDESAYRLKRASLHDHLRQHELAVRDCDTILEQSPDRVDVLQLRGSAKFKLGDIKGSIQDFDAAIKLKPGLEIRHWQRGISYYYAGRFAAGARQFQLYQTYDGGDVENIVWRFVCQARIDGVEPARRDIMRLESPDPRVPMAEIYDLFRGRAVIEDVLEAARRGDPDEESLKIQLFYAHLYIGLYLEATGHADLAAQHLQEADRREISHYMWDVAHVHAQRIRDKVDE